MFIVNQWRIDYVNERRDGNVGRRLQSRPNRSSTAINKQYVPIAPDCDVTRHRARLSQAHGHRVNKPWCTARFAFRAGALSATVAQN
ncbi:hypothetical protein J6590_039052 [Homalodisca vitripennis]|nr:hypothetical protein J6590_039052 [Homalodisca vitripennis]